MSARDLTGAGIVRALGNASPAVTRALVARADRLAAAIAAREPGASVTVSARGAGELVVHVSAPGLFAREFGSLGKGPDSVIGPAIDDTPGDAP